MARESIPGLPVKPGFNQWYERCEIKNGDEFGRLFGQLFANTHMYLARPTAHGLWTVRGGPSTFGQVTRRSSGQLAAPVKYIFQSGLTVLGRFSTGAARANCLLVFEALLRKESKASAFPKRSSVEVIWSLPQNRDDSRMSVRTIVWLGRPQARQPASYVEMEETFRASPCKPAIKSLLGWTALTDFLYYSPDHRDEEVVEEDEEDEEEDSSMVDMMNYNSDDEMDEEDNADRVWKEQLDLFGEGRGWRKENKAAFIRRWKEAKRTEGQVTANNIWDQLAAENMNDGKIGFYEDFDNNRNAAGGDIAATLEWLYGSAFRAALWADIELVHPLEGLVIPALRQPFTWQRICLCKQVKQAIARNNANAPGVAEVVSAALELAVVDCPLHGHCVMCEMSKGDCFCVLWQMWHVCRHCHHQVLVCQCQPRPFQKCMQQHAPPP